VWELVTATPGESVTEILQAGVDLPVQWLRGVVSPRRWEDVTLVPPI
jgi:hypothetical protein